APPAGPARGVVRDRGWTLVAATAPVPLFTDGLRPDLLGPPANILRVTLHPRGVAPRLVNLGEVRAHLLHRLRRQVALTGDTELAELYDELRGYPCDQPEPDVELPGAGDVVLP